MLIDSNRLCRPHVLAQRALLWIVLAGALSGVSLSAQAGLQITPPQLAPDENGVIATEVRSSLPHASRWSVRVIPWNPLEPTRPAEPTPGDAEPQAQPVRISALAPPKPIHGVEISPRFFSLSSTGRQVIRARVSDRTRHYRLLIEQIPEDTLQASKGVQFRFRFSLPIFTSTKDPLIPPGLILQ